MDVSLSIASVSCGVSHAPALLVATPAMGGITLNVFRSRYQFKQRSHSAQRCLSLVRGLVFSISSFGRNNPSENFGRLILPPKPLRRSRKFLDQYMTYNSIEYRPAHSTSLSTLVSLYSQLGEKSNQNARQKHCAPRRPLVQKRRLSGAQRMKSPFPTLVRFKNFEQKTPQKTLTKIAANSVH